MDRRKSLKALAAGSIGSGLLLSSCWTEEKEALAESMGTKPAGQPQPLYGRTPEEKDRDAALNQEQYFTSEELHTLGLLADWIIPADDESPSATETGVVDFLEFIVKDMPRYQLPLRGGLRWLDHECGKRWQLSFAGLKTEQQQEVLDDIAFPEEAAPEMSQGVHFFNVLRNLVATGYFTSKAGIAYLGYQGNVANIWDGVPEEVLKEHGLSYDAKTLATAVRQEERNEIMRWDEEGI